MRLTSELCTSHCGEERAEPKGQDSLFNQFTFQPSPVLTSCGWYLTEQDHESKQLKLVFSNEDG